MQYDNPSYLIMREKHIGAGTYSASAAGTAFNGTTLKTYSKMLVLGALAVVASGASVGSTVAKTLGIGRIQPSGTLSNFQKFSCTISATTSAAADQFDLSLTTPMTIASFGEVAVIVASSATAADHGCVLSDVVWRYCLIGTLPANKNVG